MTVGNSTPVVSARRYAAAFALLYDCANPVNACQL